MPEHIIGERYSGNKAKKVLLPILLFIGTIIFYQTVFSSSFEDIYTLNVTFPSENLKAGDSATVSVNATVLGGGDVYSVNSIEVNMGNGFSGEISCDIHNVCTGNISTIYSDGGTFNITAKLCYINTYGSTTRCPSYGTQTNRPEGMCCVTETSQVQVESITTSTCNNGVIDGKEECDGTDLNGKTCKDYGFDGGSLKCAGCSINTSECTKTQTQLPTGYPNALVWKTILEFLEYAVIWIFRIGTGLAILMILIGAFIMVTSAGDPNRAEKGKKTVIWAIIGFAVTMTVNGIIALVKGLMGAK